jgi:uncharacterized protein (DUF2147 family)
MKLTKKIGLLAVVFIIVVPVAIAAAKHKKNAPVTDISGWWDGTYQITSPQSCKGIGGSWVANATQTGTKFTGNYVSDLVTGSVSGKYKDSRNFIWTVNGNGIITFKGKVTNPTTVSGHITSRAKCPGTHKKMQGSFVGTKEPTDE